MKKIFFILLTLLTSSAHSAEVFKCQLKSGKTVYQSLPCESAAKQQAIEIQEPDPRKVAEEEAKLKAWEEGFAKREEARIKAEKEQQAELDRRAAVEALKRSSEYQQQQTIPNPYYQQYQFYPYYPIYHSFPPYPSHHHNIKENTVPDTPPSGQTDIKSGKDTDGGNNDPSSLLRGSR